jgi:isoprenylcysteine carboxyl methyltransferase (ICMT) family protein YpbQ
MVAVHAVWLISLWVLGHDQPLHVIALLFYLVLQALRVWVMRTLGARWTTGIIELPEHPLVSVGPYRKRRLLIGPPFDPHRAGFFVTRQFHIFLERSNPG